MFCLTDPRAKRFPIAFQAVFALASLIGILMLPDTPRWYYARNRNQEADAVLARLHDLPLEHENVQRQRDEILASIKLEEEDANRFRWTSLVWDTTDLRAGRRIRIAFLLLALQQMMGDYIVSFVMSANWFQASTSWSTIPLKYLRICDSLTSCPRFLQL